MTPEQIPTTRKLLGPILAAALLAGIAYQKEAQFVPSAEAGQYHVGVAAAAGAIPWSIGEWVGREQPVPKAARELLNPNALVSRRYTHTSESLFADLLFVHTKDIEGLIGHYPPVCYRNAGYALDSTEERDWLVDGTLLHGKRYVFSWAGNEQRGSIVVDNFMILPDGSVVRDMEGVERAARDMRKRYLGAAQVQVLTDASLSPGRRDAVFAELVQGCLPVLRRMSSGVDAK